MQPRTTIQHRTYVGLLFNWFYDLVLMGGGTDGYRVEPKITVIYCCFDAGLSLQKNGFDPWPMHVRFLVDIFALGQVFAPSTSVFASQYHSTKVAC